MRLGDLAFESWAADDLRWFWTWANGELGAGSNFGGMVAQLEMGTAGGGGVSLSEIEDRVHAKLEAAGRARRISRALERMRRDDIILLRMVFGSHSRVLPGLGPVGAIARYTPAAREAFSLSKSDKPIEEWLIRLGYRCERRTVVGPRKQRRADERATVGDQRVLEVIRRQADAMIRTALVAFASARRGTHDHRR